MEYTGQEPNPGPPEYEPFNRNVRFLEQSCITLGRFAPLPVKKKLSPCLTKNHAMKTYWGVEV